MLGGWKLKQTGRWFVSAVCVFVCVYEDRQAKGTLLSVVRKLPYTAICTSECCKLCTSDMCGLKS